MYIYIYMYVCITREPDKKRSKTNPPVSEQWKGWEDVGIKKSRGNPETKKTPPMGALLSRKTIGYNRYLVGNVKETKHTWIHRRQRWRFWVFNWRWWFWSWFCRQDYRHGNGDQSSFCFFLITSILGRDFITVICNQYTYYQ